MDTTQKAHCKRKRELEGKIIKDLLEMLVFSMANQRKIKI